MHDPVPDQDPDSLPRRRLLAGAALSVAAPALIGRGIAAPAVTWRIGHDAPAAFPLNLRLAEAAGVIEQTSGGAMRLQVIPDGEAGSPLGLLAQVRAGGIEAAMLSCRILSNDLVWLGLPRVGFAFTGYDVLWPALDGAFGAFLRSAMQDQLGMTVLDRCWDFGFRQVSTRGRVIRTAADLAGVRLRTQPDADFVMLFQALRALPVNVPLESLPIALQSGAVQGQESVIGLLEVMKLEPFETNVAMTRHMWDGFWLCISKKAWSALPDKLQAVAVPALNEAAIRQRQDVAAQEADMRRALERGGLVFNQPDIASFRATLRDAGYYAGWRQRMSSAAWTMLEKTTGPLT